MEAFKYTHLAASALIKTGPGILHSVTIQAGSDAATVVIGDEVATAGDTLLMLAAATAGTSACAILDVAFGVGLYATITGTAPGITVTYA